MSGSGFVQAVEQFETAVLLLDLLQTLHGGWKNKSSEYSSAEQPGPFRQLSTDWRLQEFVRTGKGLVPVGSQSVAPSLSPCPSWPLRQREGVGRKTPIPALYQTGINFEDH